MQALLKPEAVDAAQPTVVAPARMSAWGDASVFFGTAESFSVSQHVQKKAKAGNV